MQTPQKRSIGQQIVCGLSVGCGGVILVQLYFWLAFHSRRPVEIDRLYEATSEVLLVSGIMLFIASLAMSGSRSKLVAWGLIIAVLAILAAIISPLNVVRA
jgi:hypothetical protein